jgi:hypothetical protein
VWSQPREKANFFLFKLFQGEFFFFKLFQSSSSSSIQTSPSFSN